jgi:glycosyltransferase involved in cell wall biosynthesis
MRIAYILAEYGIPLFGQKGASIHVQELVNAFAGLGHDVHVFCARLGSEENRVRASVTELQEPVPDIWMGSDARSAGGGQIAKELRKIEMGRLTERAVVEQHERTPFDLIYERYALWSRAGVGAARQLRVPCFIEVNSPLRIEQSRYRQLILSDVAAEIEADVFTAADRVLAVSAPVRDYCLTRGAKPQRVHVCPNGVNLEAFHPGVPPAQVDRFNDDPVIGFVGSLKRWHGLEDLLRAFRLVLREHAAARLLIVGDGPMRAWIEDQAGRLSLDDRIHVTGWVPYRDLPRLLNRMDVAVAPYPAFDDFYFSPLKLFEYLAAGRAIVASSVGQVAEIIADGVNGLLAGPGNPQHLAHCLCRALDDRSLRKRLGRAARTTAKRYSWASNARKIVELALEPA